MATYLKSLPQSDPRSRGVAPPLTEEVDKLLARGGKLQNTLRGLSWQSGARQA